ncbi:Crp/Fnr family transcriptional regulator [Pararcticibacter amylolyticus]|uniref:HTH crp-type domain-containing protein n=1 Tax=Pararcticibacter amylolyticus TaxID=2173175 RepID=A0A2U2PKX0_9SPHI|nr:Crp/Fnr family transcriptional regulator [Pararcticibacter amylolyticus]PWG81924.1 hypothetical protein DDR33_02510 [Pararcticibacter amylolyticus]
MKETFTFFLKQRELLYHAIIEAFPERAKIYPQGALLAGPSASLKGGWIVVHGLVKEYWYDSPGNQVVSGFLHSRDIIVQDHLLYGEAPEPCFFELIEDSELIFFSIDEMQISGSKRFPADMLHQISLTSLARQRLYNAILRLPLKEAVRYIKALYPLNRIQRKDLASFMGVTASTVSRALQK